MSDTSTDPRRAELASRFLVLALVGIFVVGLLGFVSAVISAGEEEPSASPTVVQPDAAAADLAATRFRLALDERTAAVASPPATSPPASAAASPGTAAPPGASAAPSGSLAPSSPQAIPVAVVGRFWARKDGIARRDVVQALREGRVQSYKRVIVEDRIREALASELGIELHEDVRGGDADDVAAAVARGALGLIAATDIVPSVKALSVDGRSLFGNGRVRNVEAWPLQVTLDTPAGEGWDQASTWVLVAGGDSFTARGVHNHTLIIDGGTGVGFPFGGGTAVVTGHGCCDPTFHENVVPRYRLTGNKGMVRRLFTSAELAILNLESPITDDWSFRLSGTRFSGKPDLTRIFVRGGIDWVSIANNHIKDYGADGIADTRRILRRYGIRFGGAGKNLKQARRISYLDAGPTRLAIIPCVAVVPFAWASPNDSGGTPCLDRYIVPDIKKAKKKADLVIVFPHWGVEYTRRPLPSQRKHAARWVKAGADLILGAHSHVAGAIEDIDGRPVLYSLGNLIFDQYWSTATMESVILEATFAGPKLVQMRLHPFITHKQSQPNLLDPSRGEGRRLLRKIQAASKSWLDW